MTKGYIRRSVYTRDGRLELSIEMSASQAGKFLQESGRAYDAAKQTGVVAEITCQPAPAPKKGRKRPSTAEFE